MQLNTKKYDAFCLNIFEYACLRRKTIAIEEIQNYEKIVYIKHIFKNGKWGDAYPSSYPPEFAPGHKLQKPSKEFGIFQSLGTISFVLFH